MGKRLFIAADIGESTRRQIADLSSEVRHRLGAHTKASWVRPDRVHLTLHFFGDTDAPLEERVRRALAEPIAEPPFDVSLQGLGLFPERGSPRVLWVGIRDGIGALRRVHAALDVRLASGASGQGASRAFTPHLTLARFRDRPSRAQIAEIVQIPARAGPSRIDRVTLYESRLSPEGATYLPLADAPLET